MRPRNRRPEVVKRLRIASRHETHPDCPDPILLPETLKNRL
jgi:hypothetical protein